MDIAAIVRMLKPDVANVSQEQLETYVSSVIGIWKSFHVPATQFCQVWQVLNQEATLDISTLSVPPSVENSIRCNISNCSFTYDNLLKKQIENVTSEELEHKIVLFLCRTSLPFNK